jgi:lipopolysaccharide/colanic/teichoic acid biosynthesis glycosyltransferase
MSTPELHLPVTAPSDETDYGAWLWLDFFSRQQQWQLLGRAPAALFVADEEDAETRTFTIAKRALDIVVSSVLLLLLSPLLAVLAVMIVVDSPGPAFFRHTRIGCSGAPFHLWKLRSMHMNVPRYEPSPTTAVDARITRVGRWIRRVSLDEVPQLFNVLRGEMSLVGPRPEMPFIVERYTALEQRRLMARPGITGLWQISSARAYPIHHNLQYDLYYIRHANILLDLAILMRTITAVVRGVGAV